MSLNYVHKPNYFFFAQLLARHFEQGIKKNPEDKIVILEIADIGDIFHHDFAATTTNLEPILNICDEYTVETLNGDQRLISGYKINSADQSVQFNFNEDAHQAILNGKPIIEPDPTSYL